MSFIFIARAETNKTHFNFNLFSFNFLFNSPFLLVDATAYKSIKTAIVLVYLSLNETQQSAIKEKKNLFSFLKKVKNSGRKMTFAGRVCRYKSQLLRYQISCPVL